MTANAKTLYPPFQHPYDDQHRVLLIGRYHREAYELRKSISEIEDIVPFSISDEKHEEAQRTKSEYQSRLSLVNVHLDVLYRANLLMSAEREGIEVEVSWLLSKSGERPLLSEAGARKCQRKVWEARRTKAKEWVAVFMPVLSAVIAILGLIVAYGKPADAKPPCDSSTISAPKSH